LLLEETVERQLLDEADAAKYLNMSVATLRRYRYGIGDRNDGPPVVKIGHLVRYPREGLRDYISARQQPVVRQQAA
jgi:hypothetical protein